MSGEIFDPYYETKVIKNWGKSKVGSSLGFLFVFIGLGMVAFSIGDLSAGESSVNGSSWQENSIWPTIGKGIWVGAILVATGVIGIISSYERTLVSLYIFHALIWVSIVFSLFLILSSILHIEPYMAKSFTDLNIRDTNQNAEVSMNSLLIASGSLGFITGLFAVALTCMFGDCCRNRKRYEQLENNDTRITQFPDTMSVYPINNLQPIIY